MDGIVIEQLKVQQNILLGTSFGELYEYILISPNVALGSGGKAKSSSPFDTKAGEMLMDDVDNEPMDTPILLSRLNSTANSTHKDTVGGILFQRVMGGIGAAPSSAAGGSPVGGGSMVVLVSTCGLHRHTMLHSFCSEPSPTSSALRSAFSRGSKQTVTEVPGSIDIAEVCSCSDGSFAVRTETGIYYGSIERAIIISSLANAGMLAYDSLLTAAGQHQSSGGGALATTPLCIGLTPHHFVTLSSVSEVRFINRVAQKVIQKEQVDWASVSQISSLDNAYGSIGGLTAVAELVTDIRRPDQIWLRKGRALVHISSSNEERDVWKYTLSQCIEMNVPSEAHSGSASLTSEEKHVGSQFEHAKSLCSNSAQLAVVNAVRSEYYLSKGRVELAPHHIARCPPEVMPFDETAARLVLPMIGGISSNVFPKNNSSIANDALQNSNMALITFLSDKMKVAKAKNDLVTCTILGTWMTELHLQERELREKNNINSGSPRSQQSGNHALLHQFLSSYVGIMDPKTIIEILSSHNISAGESAGYSAAAGDIEAAVNAAMSTDDENGALDALCVLNDSPIEKAADYYYKYALALLCRAPTATSKSFVVRYLEGLNENKLLSAFMHYEQRRKANALAPFLLFADDPSASIRYLEGVIKLGSKSRSVFNYITSLYAKMEDEGPLFRFISEHVPAASSSVTSVSTSHVGDLTLQQTDEEENSPLDKGYALRTIMRTGRHFRSAVKLYMGFGMRQQAVELALKVDPSLARELARQSDDRDETKRLWLLIAWNAAANLSSENGKDIVAQVVMVLKDCGPDVLSIEDVLPFLPDFAQIDQFKEEICDALQSYSYKIDHYLKEMTECVSSCDTLQEELHSLKTTGTTRTSAYARCALTNKHILGQSGSFYAFPSGYVVLEVALRREIITYLNEKQRGRVEFIQEELARLRSISRYSSIRATPYQVMSHDDEMRELQIELDGLIAAECP